MLKTWKLVSFVRTCTGLIAVVNHLLLKSHIFARYHGLCLMLWKKDNCIYVFSTLYLTYIFHEYLSTKLQKHTQTENS